MAKKHTTIRIPELQLKYLDHFASKFKQPRTDLINEAIALYTLKLRKEEKHDREADGLAQSRQP